WLGSSLQAQPAPWLNWVRRRGDMAPRLPARPIAPSRPGSTLPGNRPAERAGTMASVTDVAPVAGSAQHGRRSLTVEQRRAEILEATRRVVLARGFGHTRIADVAAELGVSTGLIHYHFASKDALLAETLRVTA